MALWRYSCGKWETVTVGPFRTAFIVCQGPSLAGIDTASLTGPGRVVIAVNNAYPAVRPDFWIGMDDSGCYEQRLFWEPFPKIMRGGYQRHAFGGGFMCDAPATFFADVEKGGDMWRYQIDGKFSWHEDTFRVALQFALAAGAVEIHFVGVDLNNRNKEYADETRLNDGLRERNQRLYDQQFEFLRGFVAQAGWRGIGVGSCSRGSRINELMPYLPVAEVIDAVEAGVPSGRPRAHVLM